MQNGISQLAGQENRLKTIKRMMSGRARIDLELAEEPHQPDYTGIMKNLVKLNSKITG
jgi:hypothetical protein